MATLSNNQTKDRITNAIYQYGSPLAPGDDLATLAKNYLRGEIALHRDTRQVARNDSTASAFVGLYRVQERKLAAIHTAAYSVDPEVREAVLAEIKGLVAFVDDTVLVVLNRPALDNLYGAILATPVATLEAR